MQSKTQKWRECEVSAVLDDGKRWRIHYKGFNSKWDEEVDAGLSDRLTTESPESVVPKRAKKKKTAAVEKDKVSESEKVSEERRVWVESSNHPDIHREALVVGEEETRLKVHFISYSTKYDCWLEKTSHRLKETRPRGEVLQKGDNVSCWSKEFKGW